MILNDSVGNLPSVGPAYQKKLTKLGILSVKDLLTHIPVRFSNYGLLTQIKQLRPDQMVSLKAEVLFIKNLRTRTGKIMQMATVRDETAQLNVVWFNQPFLTKALFPGRKINLAGKVGFFARKLALISPEYEIVYEDRESTHTQGFVAVYPETAGLSSKWLRARVKYVLSKIEIHDYLPASITKKNKLVDLGEAYKLSHVPKSEKEYTKGIKRLAFDELLFLHIESIERKSKWVKLKLPYILKKYDNEIKQFIRFLPFELTPSQKTSVEDILADLTDQKPMNRLLEGDVGSGKTVVAAVAAFLTFLNGYQTLLMAPTQILANQHFLTFKKLFEPYKLRIALLTSTLKKTELGRNDIFIGTHSLIAKHEKFDRVGLTIIDEQHRFGVVQRDLLTKKGSKGTKTTHTLTMTATPIPRSVALTLYGDLDVSRLTESPLGRQKVTTWVVPPAKRKAAHKWIQKEIEENSSQVFYVCPLIDESEVETMVNVRSAKKEFENLKSIFPKLNIGLLHGQMKPLEKEKVLNAFKNEKIDILVSTPVVEVGIDVPNATIMVVETAERFGLASLHQLRGRVGRGHKKSYCLLFTESSSKKVKERLSALTKLNSGFELAELDLKLRGPGEIFGSRQHGLAELKIASWSDVDLIKKTKQVAFDLQKNPEAYKILVKEISQRLKIN